MQVNVTDFVFSRSWNNSENVTNKSHDLDLKTYSMDFNILLKILSQ